MTYSDTATYMENERKPLRPPGPDARDIVPDVRSEALGVVQDLIAERVPTTVLGVLLDRRRPMELVTISGLINMPVPQVEWTVEVLEDEGYCHRFDDGNIAMVRLSEDWS